MTPYDRLDKAIEEHALARGAWTTVAQGREIACLAATLDPEVGRQRRAAACDAKIMPAWFAELTVRIDDRGTDDRTNPDGIYWTTMRRYARTIRRAAILTPAAWKRCLHGCNAVSVREARSHVPAGEAKTLAAIDGVLVLLDRACSGGTVTDDEWSAAWAAARAAWAAAAGAAWAAEAAAWVAAAAAQDRMSAGWLDVIDAALAAKEDGRG